MEPKVPAQTTRSMTCCGGLPNILPQQPTPVVPCQLPLRSNGNDENASVAQSYDVLGPFAQLAWPKDSRHDLYELVAMAWAEVLHTYTGSDVVSFSWVDCAERAETTRQLSTDVSPCKSSSGQLRQPSLTPMTTRTGICLCERAPVDTGDAPFGVSWRESSMETVRASRVCSLVDFTGQLFALDPSFDVALRLPCDRDTSLQMLCNVGRVHMDFARSIVSRLEGALQSVLAWARTSKYVRPSMSPLDEAWIRMHNSNTLTASHECVHDLFAQQVQFNSHAEAVSSWDACLSYADVDRLSTCLGQHLMEMGTRPGSFIPLMMNKSSLVPVAVLAVLKAGACYIPLNPDTPGGRLGDILKDADAQLVIASDAEEKRDYHSVKVIVLTHDFLSNLTSRMASSGCSFPMTLPSQPCACIFTSGSTGKAKGVVLSHRALSTNLASFAGAFNTRDLRIIQCSSLAFDVAHLQILTPLTFGGCVCIPHEDEYKIDLAKAINRMSANAMLIVPSHATVIDPEDVPRLEAVLFAGEMIKSDVLRRWSHSRARLMNGYGPSEASPLSTLQICDPSAHQGGRIGHPFPSHRAIVVDADDHSRLAPVGAIGELLLAGACLADGYLSKPDLTNASFIASPPWAHDLGLSESRFYCTGDLVRYDVSLMDGSLELIGRRDTQIKLRGQKVELEEVELCLRELRGVQTAMASLARAGQFAGQLVGVVAVGPVKLNNAPVEITTSTEFLVSTAKERMKNRLPDFMIPASFVVVKDLLYTASNKLDRRRMGDWLDEVDLSLNTEVKPEFEELAPSETAANIIADNLADICTERGIKFKSLVAGKNVSLDDVALDSIQRIRVTHSVQSRFGIQIPSDVVFGPEVTVRTLAHYVETCGNSGQSTNGCGNLDLLQEVQDLRSSIGPKRACTRLDTVQSPNIKRIFLTGATGFLGIEILRQLLEQSEAEVIALVRGGNDHAAREKLIKQAIQGGWWRENLRCRVKVWQGDLTRQNFGLDDHQMDQLKGHGDPSEHITAIIHNGAVVHYRHDYAALRDANVTSTVQLLEIQRASAERGHRLKFVFVSGGQHLILNANPSHQDIAEIQERGTGYSKSKLVSEMLVRFLATSDDEYTNRCPMSIVKPGYIVGTKDGSIKPVLTDFIWRFVITCVSLRAVSQEHLNNWIPLADASTVAKTIVAKICPLEDFENSSITHDDAVTTRVSSGLTLASLINILTLEIGCSIEQVPKKEWLRLLRQAVEESGHDHPLFPLMDQFVGDFDIFQPEREGVINSEPTVGDIIRANIRALYSMGALST